MRQVLLILALAMPGALAAKKPDPATAVCPQPVKPVLFLSPMGEPFRPAAVAGAGMSADPVRTWFDQADRDHDGRLTIGEMMLDADRFFATLDKDHNGELLPDEVTAYEEDVAPEVRLYQRRPDRSGDPRADTRADRERMRAAMKARRGGDDGAMGAGRYAFLNIPNPIASADDDINRAVSKAEFRSAAAERFRDLNPAQKKSLTLADLPRTPAQIAAIATCLAQARAEASGKRTPPR